MFVPKVPIKNINQPRWFTPFIRHKVKCLRTQKRKYEKYPTELNKSKVDEIASELHLAMAEAKSDYESNLIFNFAHTHNNKIYQYISNIKGHDNFPTQMFHNNQQACNDQEKAQLFNNYFYSVFSSDITIPVSESALSTSTSTLQDIEITESEVLTILSSLDGNKAPGIDNISPIVYKCCALSLYSSQFVTCLQLACPLVIFHPNGVLTRLHLFTKLAINL